MNQNLNKTSVKIPSFSLKSAFLIAIVAAISSILIPATFTFLGIPREFTTIVSTPLGIGLIVAYCHCFVETKKRFCKQFYLLFAFIALATAFICYFWLFIGLYI